ncbi:MAG TPA: FecR family protein, partial [Candidatus Baltobacteraceae bacterium]|nr:FecR family protein [Candidatus Baltobacteraceae bacterium]
MRRFIAVFLTAGFLALNTVPPAQAAGDKSLQNLKGSVSYKTAAGATQQVAARASVVLNDSDTAETGAASMGAIDLPDSSRILLGANSKVVVDSFNQSDITSATFEVVGKVRFKVEHPKGARANYVFKGPTAQIAVRGTAGDIDFGPDTIQVNVYELTDPALPVQVTLANGQTFFLHAGQSLLLHVGPMVAGGASGGVSSVSQSSFQDFSEFGMPANASAIGLTSAALGHIALMPLITAVVFDTALLTVTSHQTTSTVSGPNNTNVPVHVTVRFPIGF